jgi:hypothetical protein
MTFMKALKLQLNDCSICEIANEYLEFIAHYSLFQLTAGKQQTIIKAYCKIEARISKLGELMRECANEVRRKGKPPKMKNAVHVLIWSLCAKAWRLPSIMVERYRGHCYVIITVDIGARADFFIESALA